MWILKRQQQMSLMTPATRMRWTVLTDNLGIALVLSLVFLKANETFFHVYYTHSPGIASILLSLCDQNAFALTAGM